MKRDLDLIRELLLDKLLAQPGERSGIQKWTSKGYSVELVNYHYELICQAGFSNGIQGELTFDGQFIACLLSNNGLWSDAVSAMKGASLESLPLSVMVSWMGKEALRRMESTREVCNETKN